MQSSVSNAMSGPEAKFCFACGRPISQVGFVVPAAASKSLLPLPSINQGKRIPARNNASILFGMGLVLIIVVGVISSSTSSHPTATQSTDVANLATLPPIPPTPPVKPKTAAQLKKEARDAELIAETERDVVAKVIENTMLGEGRNVDVNAIGPHHTTLRLKWALVSKVTAYQFQRDGQEMFRTMEKAGFTKFVITDGYDETWTWHLQPSK